ncbi:hypothetical protein BC826DRAFT_996961 [Russula brevipes]|nr:hypothetical protein BC826DRAFT_996961 [Russula brevipes]
MRFLSCMRGLSGTSYRLHLPRPMHSKVPPKFSNAHSQTSFSLWNPSHQHFLVHPSSRTTLVITQRNAKAPVCSSRTTTHSLSHIIHVMRAARAVHPWIPTHNDLTRTVTAGDSAITAGRQPRAACGLHVAFPISHPPTYSSCGGTMTPPAIAVPAKSTRLPWRNRSPSISWAHGWI